LILYFVWRREFTSIYSICQDKIHIFAENFDEKKSTTTIPLIHNKRIAKVGAIHFGLCSAAFIMLNLSMDYENISR